MSVANPLNTQNQSIHNYDYSKVFRTTFKTVPMTYTNSSGGDVVLVQGMLFGRISANLEGAILASASVDGSEIPFGINMTEKTVANTESIIIQVAVTGMMDSSKLVLDGTDTLDTLIDGRTIGDRIPADTEGITLEDFEQLVNLDNQ